MRYFNFHTSAIFVEMIEWRPELCELFLCDSFGITGENLIFYFIDIPIDRC